MDEGRPPGALSFSPTRDFFSQMCAPSTQAAAAPTPPTAPTPPKKKKSSAKLKRLSGEALAAYNARIQNCGVCYIARVPPYMKPSARDRTKTCLWPWVHGSPAPRPPPVGGVDGQVHFAQRVNSSFAPTVNASTTFRYSSHSSGPISSHPPRFAWTPGEFNSRKLPWPPRGVRLNVSFAAPADCPNQALTAHVIYELYDAIPVFSKWVGPLQ